MQTPWKLLDKIAGLYFEGLEVQSEGLKAVTRRLSQIPLPPLSVCLGMRPQVYDHRREADLTPSDDLQNPPTSHR